MTERSALEQPRPARRPDDGAELSVTVYHHTHWDREWWTTRRDFSIRLADLLDRLLDILDADPNFTSFVLDGQMVMLEDYLELRPEQRERLVARIREGRIDVGPWYVLADTLLPSGESTIRNLWLGRRVAEALGVQVMPVGYLPDQFGHAAQIPQLLRGFGIEAAVVWRGFGAPPPGQSTDPGAAELEAPPDAELPYYPRVHGRGRFPEEMQSEFWWQSPDGSRVLGLYLAHEYYVPHAPEEVLTDAAAWLRWVARERRTIEYLRAFATGNRALHPYGGDHLPVDGRLPTLLARLNDVLADEGIRLRQGSLVDYVGQVRGDPTRVTITWHGEGRAFGRKAHLLPGVASSRLPLKRLNHDAQVALERWAEPLQALAWLLGGPYEDSALWAAWRLVVQNQPHDSITGCSIDEVHRQNAARYEEAIDLARFLALRAGERIAGGLATDDLPEGGHAFVVFNTLGFARTDAARALVDPELGVTGAGWRLLDAEGREIPFQVRAVTERRTAVPSRRWTEVAFVARDMPGLGYRRYCLEPRIGALPTTSALDHTILGIVARGKGAARTGDLAVAPCRLENAHLVVEVDPRNGAVALTDRGTGLRYEGLAVLDDGGDAGDEYSYSWPVGDVHFSTRDVRPSLSWLETGPARATLRISWSLPLPVALSDDRRSRSAAMVPMSVHADLTLHAGVDRLDIRFHGENPAHDHRLRALFPLGRPAAVSKAESAFVVVERPVAIDEVERGSAEPAVPEFPQQAFTSVDADGRGLTVANRGLTEAAVLDDEAGTVAVTLLRCVGYLSHGDLLARIGGAGPLMPTPEAQLPGPFAAEVSLIPHAGSWSEARSHRAAHAFAAGLLTVDLPGSRPLTDPRRRHDAVAPADLPAEGSLLEVEGPVEVSAVKRSEDGTALVLRLLNQSAQAATARVRPRPPIAAAHRLSLAEDRLAEFGLVDGRIELELEPWQLVTIGLERAL